MNMHKMYTLDNGFRVAVKTMNHMESVSLGIWIAAGGRYEEKRTVGVSHFLEHLLFKGTETRDMKKIKEEIEGRGGSFNGFTAEEFTCYLVKVLSKDAGLGVDILSDMVLRPRLAEEEMAKEKSVIVEEINMYKDMPSQHVHEILAELLWPDHPLGMPLAGTAESVNSLTKGDIKAYKDMYYNPKNMLLVAAGRISEEKAMGLARNYLSKTLGHDVPKFRPADAGRPGQRLSVNFKETEQTHLALGMHTLNRLHPDRYVLAVMNILLGANMSSRLFHIVRDEMALCYEIASSARLYEDAGTFVISAGVDDKKLVRALEVVLKEMGRMKREPVSDEELRRAKEYYKGQLLFALEDTMSYMLWFGEKIITNEKELNVKKILDKVERVKPDDLMRMANDLFTDENMNLAVIGPIKDDKNIREALHIK